MAKSRNSQGLRYCTSMNHDAFMIMPEVFAPTPFILTGSHCCTLMFCSPGLFGFVAGVADSSLCVCLPNIAR